MFKKEGGFTILELLITIGLIGIIIPAVYLSINALVVINKRSRNIAIVNIVADNKVESLRSKGYNNIPSGESTFTNELPTELPKPNSAKLTVTTANGKKTVDITIAFQDYNKQRTVNYRTIISELGIGQ